MKATYTKLNSGDWGIRVEGAPEAGAEVTVSKKDGSEKIETVTAVIWQGEGIAICSIEQARKRGGCNCEEQGCCRPRCHCEAHCNCRGGNIYDC